MAKKKFCGDVLNNLEFNMLNFLYLHYHDMYMSMETLAYPSVSFMLHRHTLLAVLSYPSVLATGNVSSISTMGHSWIVIACWSSASCNSSAS